MFKIIAENPSPKGRYDPSDEDIGEAVETVFEGDNSYIHFEINGLRYSLGYKYDVSCIIYDISDLLKLMLECEAGEKEVQWACNAFEFNWVVAWDSKEVKLDIHDRGKDRKVGIFIIDKNEFLREFSKILRIVIHYLDIAGYADHKLPWLISIKDMLKTI